MPSILDYFTNSSIITEVLVYFNRLTGFLSEPDQLTAVGLVFDEFQLKLLFAFTVLLFLNLLLLFGAWKYYGRDIYDRFIRLSSTKEIEELKASVSKLKLPREHTPRI